MSALRNAVGVFALPFDLQGQMAPTCTERVLAQLQQRLATVRVVEPAMLDLEEAYRCAVEVVRGERDIGTVSRRLLGRLPWVLFRSWDGNPPLAEDSALRSALNRELARRRDGATCVQLVEAFFAHYPRELNTFDEWREEIGCSLREATGTRCARFRDHVKRHRLLEPDGPVALWRAFWESELGVEDWLVDVGLTGPLARQGLVEAVFEEGLRALYDGLCGGTWEPQELARLQSFSLARDGDAETLRFSVPRYRVGLAEALLTPFAEGKPDSRLCDPVKSFLLHHYGDPRLDPGGWHGVSERAREVIHGWLVEDTLEDFFRLLAYVSRNEPVARRHWRYRKAFWSAYLRHGVIRDAWVVLSPTVDLEARRRLRHSAGSYGKLLPGVGVLRNHAVLVLRIGTLVVTDWSHTGKYRLWREEVEHAKQLPRLYRKRYSRSELVDAPDHEGVHYGAENGSWQANLNNYIRSQTGIRIRHMELMPRKR